MARMSESDIAQRIVDHAKDMGYYALRDSSKLSASKYVGLAHDKLPDQTVKVRVSGHDLPQSYGSPGDLDVYTNERPSGTGIHWTDAIANLAGRVGSDVPALAKREITRRHNIQVEAERCRKDNVAAEVAARAAKPPSVADQQRALFAANYPGSSDPAHKLAARYNEDFPDHKIAWVRSFDPRNYDKDGIFKAAEPGGA